MFWTPYPKALPSFNEPIEPPLSEPDEGVLITARFAEEWLKYIEGALQQLELQATWKGTDDEIYVAQRRAAYLKELIATGGLDAVEPPFWDEPDGGDSEDEDTADGQIWYGLWQSGVGFVDSLAGFVFTGFVAANFGVGAAVTFATTLTKFRLAFRTRDTGAILRVLLDDDTFALVDTFSESPGVKTIDIVSPGTTLIIANTGTANEAATAVDGLYSMEVIRKQLSESEVLPGNLRYDSTSDQFQRSPDDGATWVDSPGDDPRHSDVFRKPPLSGTGHECDGAARIAAQWKQTVDGFIASINQYEFATNFIALIVEFLPGAGVLIDLALIFFNILATIGISLIEGAFTDAEWHTIQCIISCHIGANGSLSAAQMDAVFAEIDATQPDVVKDTLHAIRGLYGEVLSSNFSVERTETGDCSDCACAWCYEWDFTITPDILTVRNLGGTNFGEYVAGVGFRSYTQDDGCTAHGYIYLEATYSPTITGVNKVELDFGATIGPFAGTPDYEVAGGGNFNLSNGDTQVHSADIDPSAVIGYININVSLCDTTGFFNIVKMRYRGTGTMPAFTGGTECPT